MKISLYSHINYLKKTHDQKKVYWIIKSQTDMVCYHWVRINEGNVKLRNFEPLLKSLARLLRVKVLRYPKQLENGFYVVGKEALVLQFSSYLKTIKSNVEKATRVAQWNPSKAINTYVLQLDLLVDIDTDTITNYIEVIDELIKETPILNTKKAYKW